MTEFINESAFDRKKYDLYLRRIHSEERDAINYENMLSFLYEYVKRPDSLEDYEGVVSEYIHWNEMLIEKCFYHVPHDTPYMKARRAYETVACLLAGEYDQGEEQLQAIGDAFMGDTLPPKIIMNARGTVYRQMSRNFLLYNYAKVYQKKGHEARLARLKETYSHAFSVYGDEEHKAHDDFYKDQMEDHADEIFYPVFSRIYKVPGGDREFFVYYDENQSIMIDDIP